MNPFVSIALFLLLPAISWSQFRNADSLKTVLNNAPDGQPRFKAASDVYFYYQELNRDSALYYAGQQLQVAQQNGNKIAEGISLDNKAYQLTGLGNFGAALTCLQQAFSIAENVQSEKEESWPLFPTPFTGDSRLLLLCYTHHMYGQLMLNTENSEQQIYHFKEALKIAREINYFPRIMLAYLNLGQCYLQINKPDSALFFEKQAEQAVQQANRHTYYSKTFFGTVQLRLGDIYQAMGNRQLALSYYYQSLQSSTLNNSYATLSRVCLRLATNYLEAGHKDSALYYSLKNMEVLQTLGSVATLETNSGIGYTILYRSYEMNHQPDSAYKYQGLALKTNDSLNKVRIKNLAEFQKLTYNEQLRLQNVEKEKVIYQDKIRTWFLLAGIAVLLSLAGIFYRNNRQKQKAKIIIEQAYDHLKATQKQLIQSEKMASLGELTAGIAHEIQNPLNFVNNFSEVNGELIEELLTEKAKVRSEKDETLENELLNDIKENEQKINHHGKRAGAIVKGMLEHSRQGTGEKTVTDLNALADEYLKLAWHSMRGKDSSFNVIMKTDFDTSAEKINVVPQDIGKVLLNVYNNAFYAVNEKRKIQTGEYRPTIEVSTKQTGHGILISVCDNGDGIDEKIIEKIFQPFFTTKPTGQGIGLGLSLAYDIMKAHGGELSVKANRTAGCEFILRFPAGNN